MTYISNDVMNEIRNKTDIVDVISKYVNIDENGLDIKLTRMKNKEDMTISALIASIPFINQDIK